MTPHNETIVTAASTAAAAEARHAETRAALAAAEGEANAIAMRLGDAVGRQRAIGLRRAEGREEPTDGEELVVLAADISALQALAERRDGVVAAARASAKAAEASLVSARLQLAKAEASQAEAALAEHAEALASKLLGTVRQLRATRDQLGGGLLAWRPSQELMGALTVVHHGRCW